MTKQQQRLQKFVWKEGDIVVDDVPPDTSKMSEAEKAFFLKQQKSK